MNQYNSFKGRSIDFNKPVKIYKNLHNGLFSVMQNNLVVAHIESFILDNVIFKVNESGRQKVLKEKKKNVHAFVTGYVKAVNMESDTMNSCHAQVRYNPYLASTFFVGEEKTPITKTENLCGHVKLGLFSF